MNKDISSVILENLKEQKPLKSLIFISVCYHGNTYQQTGEIFNKPVHIVKKWVEELKRDIQNSYYVTYSDVPEFQTNIDVLYEFTEPETDKET